MTWRVIAENRRLLSGETGTIIKDWGAKIPVALAFANTYRLGMSNLGFQAVYALFNAERDVVCERAFLPDPAGLAEHHRTRTTLLSLETQRPLTDFELVAFSISYENDYPRVLTMLKLAGLAVRQADRRPADPVIMAGGVTMRTNPEPMADFLDLILIGDGETIVPALIRAWRQVRLEPLPKIDRVSFLARQVPGAYAPALYRAALDPEGRLTSFEPRLPDLPSRISVARVETLPDPALSSRIITPATEFANVRLVEIGRGCGHGCRFCLAGFAYRPPRTAPASAVFAALGSPRKEGEKVGLVSPAAMDHPNLDEIMRHLIDQGREVRLSSLHLERITARLAESLALGRLRSVAVAPEAGSERLRSFINKGLTETQIMDGIQVLAEAGVKKIKLYFMLGLPSETDEDVAATIDMMIKIKERLRQVCRLHRLVPELAMTLSAFVPKPHTPLGPAPMLGLNTLKARIGAIKSRLAGQPGVTIRFDPLKESYLQALFSRGDRRVGAVIEALAEGGRNLKDTLKLMDFDPEDFVSRSMDQDGRWPWSFIDHGVSRDFLTQEMSRAWNGQATPTCRPQTCRMCGVC